MLSLEFALNWVIILWKSGPAKPEGDKMGQKPVTLKITGFVAEITLNRPESGNTIDSETAAGLKDLCSQLRADDQVRVVIISGAGQGAFCLGGEPGLSPSAAAYVAQLEVPTLAAVNGDALGQGLELALVCDLRICSKKARLALDQVAAGEIPFDGGTQRLARLVGRAKALEMILTGEYIDTAEAYRIGLVNRVVAHQEIEREARALAQALAQKGPVALRLVKEAVWRGLDLILDQGLFLEADLYSLLQTTRDRMEGIRAFQEKRTPEFEGR